MARISIDPTQEKNKPRFFNFRKKFNWPPHQAFGVLCAFWGKVAESEANESGEISDWTPDYVADQIGLGNVEPNELWHALEFGYIDKREERFFVADWLEIIGPHLKKKYHNDREKLERIWAVNGQIFGRSNQDLKRSEADLDTKDANKRGISAPEFGSLPSSLSTPLPSSLSEEDLKALDYASRAEAKTPLGFLPSQPPDKEPAAVTILQKLFIERLADKYGQTVRKVQATFNYGAAGKIFKNLLANDWGVQEIENYFSPWFDSTDPFIEKRGHCIEDFPRYLKRLKYGPIANQVGSNGKQPFYDGAATVTEESEAPV